MAGHGTSPLSFAHMALPRRYPVRPPTIGAPTRRPRLMPASRACPSATCTTGPPKKYVAAPNSAKALDILPIAGPSRGNPMQRCHQRPRRAFPTRTIASDSGGDETRRESRIIGASLRSTGRPERPVPGPATGGETVGPDRRGLGARNADRENRGDEERRRTGLHGPSNLQSSCRRIVDLHPRSWMRV